MRSNYNDKYREVGSKVAFYRNLRKLSQAELAEKVGITRGYLSQIEAPKSSIIFSLEILFAIAEGLDIDVAAFFNPVDICSPYITVKPE